MQYFTEVDVDVSVEDILYGMSQREKQKLVDGLAGEGYEPSFKKPEWEPPLPMDDPVVRLDAIDYLRKNGWKVEPQ